MFVKAKTVKVAAYPIQKKPSKTNKFNGTKNKIQNKK